MYSKVALIIQLSYGTIGCLINLVLDFLQNFMWALPLKKTCHNEYWNIHWNSVFAILFTFNNLDCSGWLYFHLLYHKVWFVRLKPKFCIKKAQKAWFVHVILIWKNCWKILLGPKPKAHTSMNAPKSCFNYPALIKYNWFLLKPGTCFLQNFL